MANRVVILFLLCSIGLSGQAFGQRIERGALLVAAEELEETNFASTVLLVLHHDNEGSLAIMINRPTTINPREIFPDAGVLGDYDGNVFFGGPIAPARPFMLIQQFNGINGNNVEILDGVLLAGDFAALPPDSDTVGPAALRVYAGHAQWGPGQLQSEIAAGAWHLAPGTPELVFATDPSRVWQRALQRSITDSEVVLLTR